MISKPLLKQSLKANWVLFAAMTGVMVVLNIQFTSMEMTKSLLFQIFYGMMATILPDIYVLLTANKLLASQVDRGSMAYVLSNPARRSAVVLTQTVFLVVTLFLMFALTAVAHIVVNAASPLDLSLAGAGLSGTLTGAMIAKIILSAFTVILAMAGVCFMCSGIFNLSKYSMGFSGTFVGVSILANMLAMFGTLGVDALSGFKYLSICTLYDYRSVLVSENDWIIKTIVAAGIAAVTFAIGGIRFCKKDLPL
ncbi:MAG: hypothetical protein QM689_10400 [Oscillospiraceae bacterium]